MYITATTILLFFILWAIVDGNEKAANARWEASDECKRLDAQIELNQELYGPSKEELKIQEEEAKKEKIKNKEETREALIALPFLVILIIFAFYYDYIVSLIPILILDIFSGIICFALLFLLPPIIFIKWKPAKFWSVHWFWYIPLLLLFIAFIASIMIIIYQKLI